MTVPCQETVRSTAIHIARAPHPLLRPFVELVWASVPDAGSATVLRERILPAASAHLVIRIGGEPVRLFADPEDRVGYSIGHAVVSGVRDAAYLKDSTDLAPTAGAVFRPGAAGAFLGVPAGDFAGCHTPLDAFWGGGAESLQAQLGEAADLAERIIVVEQALLRRLPHIRGVDPAILRATLLLERDRPVGDVAAELDCSHRHLIARFTRAVGLPPKRFARLQRFGRVLRRLERIPDIPWAELALAAGYADQAHFNRDFRGFAGISPGGYRALGGLGRHVPVR